MSFSISFSRDPPRYCPGEKVEGTLVADYEPDHTNDIKKATIELKGYATTVYIYMKSETRYERTLEWEYTSSYQNEYNYATSSYESHLVTGRNLVSRTVPVTTFTPKCASKSLSIISEKKDYFFEENLELPFSFDLPEDLPPSCRLESGSISYFLKDKQFFVVIDAVKVQQLPADEQSLERSKNIGFWGFRKGQVQMKASIPKSTFLSGDTCNLVVEIDNKSPRKIDTLQIRLKQNLIYFADAAPSKVENNTVRYMQEAIEVNANSTQTTVIPVKIPLVVSSLSYGIIHVFYKFKVSVSSKKTYNSKISVNFPIKIVWTDCRDEEGVLPNGRDDEMTSDGRDWTDEIKVAIGPDWLWKPNRTLTEEPKPATNILNVSTHRHFAWHVSVSNGIQALFGGQVLMMMAFFMSAADSTAVTLIVICLFINLIAMMLGLMAFLTKKPFYMQIYAFFQISSAIDLYINVAYWLFREAKIDSSTFLHLERAIFWIVNFALAFSFVAAVTIPFWYWIFSSNLAHYRYLRDHKIWVEQNRSEETTA